MPRQMTGPSKIPAIEARLGMSLDDYLRRAISEDLTQLEMARELRVSRHTVIRWLRERGFHKVISYEQVS